MGDSYREELKKSQKSGHRARTETRTGRSPAATESRLQAIKREQSRKTFRARAKEKAVQARLM